MTTEPGSPCPAAMLAKSLLDVWLSGDQCTLRLELERLSRAPELPADSEDPDRLELLKCMAGRMKDAPDLYAPRCESPRTGVWLDMLHHLSIGCGLAHESTSAPARQSIDLKCAPAIAGN